MSTNGPEERTPGGSFRSFLSRTISVIDVQGEAIALRKGASPTSDLHVIRLQPPPWQQLLRFSWTVPAREFATA